MSDIEMKPLRDAIDFSATIQSASHEAKIIRIVTSRNQGNDWALRFERRSNELRQGYWGRICHEMQLAVSPPETLAMNGGNDFWNARLMCLESWFEQFDDAEFEENVFLYFDRFVFGLWYACTPHAVRGEIENLRIQADGSQELTQKVNDFEIWYVDFEHSESTDSQLMTMYRKYDNLRCECLHYANSSLSE